MMIDGRETAKERLELLTDCMLESLGGPEVQLQRVVPF